MSRDVKEFVTTCDICQKAKPRRHGPVGLLNPIPIPSKPFEVISMDFIPELPMSQGFDNILVIVDKLTKYGIFIPTKTSIGEVETAKLIFKHIFCQFGLPRQIISDRDSRWTGLFWEELCKLMDIKRALTTAHHPQADGQTEILNQGLEIAIRSYVGLDKNDWSGMLDSLQFAYNTSVHTATGFSPAFLLHGYNPVTPNTILSSSDNVIERGLNNTRSTSVGNHPLAEQFTEQFEAFRNRARDSLAISQAFQRKYYNKGHLSHEFEEGDFVLINPNSLELLRKEKGRGQKLQMKYDGPFEILRKLSPVTYQLRLPASYKMHPVINITHLEAYKKSPIKFGDRVIRHINRLDFEDLPEYEVDKIIAEKFERGRGGRRVRKYKTRFTGYSEEFDLWLTKTQLRNAPEVLKQWETSLRGKTMLK